MNFPQQPTVYDATPLEQAYSYYLAQQVFGIPPGGNVHIPGRNAVPFLTQSGVDRQILRSLWSVADPQNAGSLAQMKQFQLLLRLVSMAQNGLILPSSDKSVPGLLLLVQRHKSLILNLPVFNSVMIPQPPGQLMNMYGQFVVMSQSGGAAALAPAPHLSIDDAFGGLVDVEDTPLGGLTSAPPEQPTFTAPQTDPLQHQASQVSGMSSLSGGTYGDLQQQYASTPDATSDAISEMGPPQDAPLAPLGSASGSVASSQQERPFSISGGDGSISESMSMTNQSGPTMTTTSGGTNLNMQQPNWGGVSGEFMQQQPQPSMGGLQQPAISATSQDEFGGFSDAQSFPNPSALAPLPNRPLQDDDFGGFSSAQSILSQPANTIMSDFVGSMFPPQSLGTASVDSHSTMDITDAFGDVGVQDAPLPSLETFGGGANTVHDAVPSTEDDFGDFSTAGSTTGPLPKVENDEFGSFSAAVSTTALAPPAPATADVDDFGELLGGSNAGSTPAIADDFGDLSAAGSTSAAVQPAPDPLAPIVSGNDDEDDFGDFGDFGSAAQPSVGGGPVNEVASQFSGSVSMSQPPPLQQQQQPFMTDVGQTMSEPIFAAPAVTDAGHSLSVDDAFGGLGPSKDLPLFTLDAFGVSNETANVEQPQPQSDDDFGGFETAATTVDLESSTQLTEQQSQQQEQDDSFGGFETAATMPAFGTVQGPTTATVPTSMNQDFLPYGVDNPPAVSDMGRTMSEPISSTSRPSSLSDTARSLSIDDAFGSMPGLQDAPLPSLDLIGAPSAFDTCQEPMVMSSTEDNDFGGFTEAPQAIQADPSHDFGGFEAATAPELSVENLPAAVVEEDDFGDFASTSVAPASQPNVLQFEQQSVTGIGRTMSEPITSMRVSAPENYIGRSLSVDDAFGDMPVLSDAPLPSLDMFSDTNAKPDMEKAPSVIQDEDDFGDFGEATGTAGALSSVQSVDSGGDDLGDIGAATTLEALSSTQAAVTDASAFGDSAQDAPLPSLDMFGGSAPTMILHKEQGVEDNDFGTFEEAKSSIYRSEFGDFESSKESHDADDFGDFETPKTPQEADNFGKLEAPKSSGSASTDMNLFNTETAIASKTESGEHDFLSFGQAPDQAPVASDPFQSHQAPSAATAAEHNLFGGYGNVVDGNNAEDFGNFTTTSHPSKNDGDFADFGSAEEDEKSPEHTEMESAQDDFGGAFGAMGELAATKPALITQNDDEFDAFASSSEPAKQADDIDNLAISDAPATNDEDFGAFTGTNEAPKANGRFGAFGTPSEETATLEATQDTPSDNDYDFGDFGSAEFTASAPPVPSRANENVEADDDFGDFGTAEFIPSAPSSQSNDMDNPFETNQTTETPAAEVTPNEPQQNIDDDDNDDFGDFGDFSGFEQASPAPAPSSAPESAGPDPTVKSFESGETTDDDWGDFENVSSSAGTLSEEEELRDRIQSLALQLPESLLLKSGRSGEHVDLGEAFEVNIGIKTSLNDLQKRRVERCIQVLESLSNNNAKLGSTYWAQVFDVINEEMDVANTVLAEAKLLPSLDWKKVEKLLSIMISGAGEYMRLTRSIAASIGDMLLLDASALLTIDTYSSTWCSLSILEKALEIEKKWKNLLNLANGTSLKTPTNMARLEDIRSFDLSHQASNNKLCELTLQPLLAQDQSTVKAEVSYQGKCFMACSANFLAHRCPFYVVGNDR